MSEKQIKAGEGFVRMGTLSHRKDTAFIRVRDGLEHTQSLINLPVSEFLSGVAEAFDVIVTERTGTTAPFWEKDEQGRDRLRIEGHAVGWDQNPETHRRLAEKNASLAVRHIVLAEFLEANPPVDRKALDALVLLVTEEVAKTTVFSEGSANLARHLYDRGVRVVSE